MAARRPAPRPVDIHTSATLQLSETYDLNDLIDEGNISADKPLPPGPNGNEESWNVMITIRIPAATPALPAPWVVTSVARDITFGGQTYRIDTLDERLEHFYGLWRYTRTPSRMYKKEGQLAVIEFKDERAFLLPIKYLVKVTKDPKPPGPSPNSKFPGLFRPAPVAA